MTADGATDRAVGGLVSMELVNGSYQFRVATPTGFTASPPTGWVTVSGSASSVRIGFTALGARFLGLPEVDGYLLVGGVVALAIGVTAWVVSTRRRRVPPRPTRPPR